MRVLNANEIEEVAAAGRAGDLIFGAIAGFVGAVGGLAVGFIVGGPVGAICGAGAGFLLGVGITTGYVLATSD